LRSGRGHHAEVVEEEQPDSPGFFGPGIWLEGDPGPKEALVAQAKSRHPTKEGPHMGAKAADKIHKDAEVDRLKKELAENRKKAAAETDADKKKKLEQSNEDDSKFLEGITEAEEIVRTAPNTKTAERQAIRSIETEETEGIRAMEKRRDNKKAAGDAAGAAVIQRQIDLEERKMVGKKTARESLDS
jgi:hypothetical protein